MKQRLTVLLVLVGFVLWPLVVQAQTRGEPWDEYEPNYDVLSAAVVYPGRIGPLSFACGWQEPRSCMDQDWFRLELKAGLCTIISTDQLGPGVDTNIEVYGAEGQRQRPISGNDDRAVGDPRSQVQVCVSEATTLYLLIGQAGNRQPPSEPYERVYWLDIRAEAAPTATPTPSATPLPTVTPRPPTATPRPTLPPVMVPTRAPTTAPAGGVLLPVLNDAPTSVPPTSTPPTMAQVQVAELPPVPVLVPTAQPMQATAVAFLACYDRNQSGACDPDEGIRGLTVYISDGSGALFAQLLTDQAGQARATVQVAPAATLSISVPTYGWTTTTTAQRAVIPPLIVQTVAPLPALLP